MSPPSLQSIYPWIEAPLIASAPMLNIALPSLAVSVSSAGGLGFLAGGFDVSNLEHDLEEAAELLSQSPVKQFHGGVLPIGVGFLNWGADFMQSIVAVEKYKPCAVWFFAPMNQPDDLVPWVEKVRSVTASKTQVWVQVGTVGEAVAVVDTIRPDVLVVQGSDAGGHGLAHSASLITLLPEVCDALKQRDLGSVPILAAGGAIDGRGMAASLALGASGVVMGTRFLASLEANIPRGYQNEVLRASDGGVSTVRSTVYDRVRGIQGWPDRYNGRGVINQSYVDASEGEMHDEENRFLYESELKKGDFGWGPKGRLTTYAGTGVGLVREVLPVAEIMQNIWWETKEIIKGMVQ